MRIKIFGKNERRPVDAAFRKIKKISAKDSLEEIDRLIEKLSKRDNDAKDFLKRKIDIIISEDSKSEKVLHEWKEINKAVYSIYLKKFYLEKLENRKEMLKKKSKED